MHAEAGTFHRLCLCARKVTAAVFWVLCKFAVVCGQGASLGPLVEVVANNSTLIRIHSELVYSSQ